MSKEAKIHELVKLIGAFLPLPKSIEPFPDIKHKTINKLAEQAADLSNDLDPVKLPPYIFDPTAPEMLGKVTACALLLQDKNALVDLRDNRFYGAGIYAIYFRGSFFAYSGLSNTETPIYIGSAEPANKMAGDVRKQGQAIWKRLSEHAKSISRAGNIELEDFEYRYLAVKSGMQKAAEDYLINHFKPIWNKEVKICFGFGKHGDSAETRKNKRSPWDTLHPGRDWADESTHDQKGESMIVDAINMHLNKLPPIEIVDFKSLLLPV
ncbi:MAG: Eco29kI family restriction endonuclease [Desulfobacteraceae bacterium]|nr:Eco29kI family restriction endonuclease [Desulfobacteraceae bacterium]